jgi:hypothetical protein
VKGRVGRVLDLTTTMMAGPECPFGSQVRGESSDEG